MTLDDLRCLAGAECVRLAKLGSADAIARELSSRGMTGILEDQTQCPLARGLCDTLMVATGRLRVSKYELRWGVQEFPSTWLVSFRDGLSVLREFVEAFDNGQFSSLIREEN